MIDFSCNNKNSISTFLVYLFIATAFLNITVKASDKSFICYSTTPWSVRMVESEMKRHNPYSNSWGYVEGTFLKSVEQLWRITGDSRYFQYIQNSLDAGFNSNGALKSYDISIYSLDEICEGRILLLMYNEGKGTTKYQNAIDTLRKQLKYAPRVAEGGFWHRANMKSNAYPHQMWLDGIYMANPFYAEYGKLFNEPEDFDDVVTQVTVMEKHARDSVTGLLYHGWDESKTQSWANPATGCSPSFWGRAVGWYAMALVDILDYLPAYYPDRPKVIAILQRLVEAIAKVQDPTHGTWYQVLDKGIREGNYRESSASCMFVYALAKAVRLGYIDQAYWNVVKKGYAGILDDFITTNKDSTINLIQTCATAGLGMSGGFYRDGSFNYYANQTVKSLNDGKATGPFVLASLEVEKTGLIVPPLDFTAKLQTARSAELTWNDKSYNATGFVIERKTNLDDNFKEIARIAKGTNSYIDQEVPSASSVTYRAFAYNDSSVSDPGRESVIDLTSVEHTDRKNTGFMLYQNYPNPFNPSTNIKYSVSKTSRVEIKIYDLLGREVVRLLDKTKAPGTYSLELNAGKLANGIYICKMESGKFSESKKLVLMK